MGQLMGEVLSYPVHPPRPFGPTLPLRRGWKAAPSLASILGCFVYIVANCRCLMGSVRLPPLGLGEAAPQGSGEAVFPLQAAADVEQGSAPRRAGASRGERAQEHVPLRVAPSQLRHLSRQPREAASVRRLPGRRSAGARSAPTRSATSPWSPGASPLRCSSAAYHAGGRRPVPRAHDGQQVVERREDQGRLLGPAPADGGELVPPRAQRERPLLHQPPEQRGGVRHVAEVNQSAGGAPAAS